MFKDLYKNINEQLSQIIKSPSFYALGIFGGGNIFVAVIGGLCGLIQARWLEPDVFGEFRKYGILTTYLALGISFVHDGLLQQYPYLLGKGKNKEALQVASTAKWWYSNLTIIYIILFFVLTIIALFKTNYRGAIGWGAQIAGSVALVYGAYLGVMYRTSTNFKRLSYNNIISTVLGAFELVFVKIWDYWGLAIRNILMSLTSVGFNNYYLPVKIKAKYNSKVFINLAKISLRFSIPGYLRTSALIASLNALILFYCGQKELGIYAFSITFQSLALTFSDALNQIFYVKISSKYGETNDVFKCLQYTKVPAVLGIIVSIIIALCLFLLVGPFIHLFLPKYLESISVIRILSLSIVVKGISLPLIVISSALWYRTFAVMCGVNFSVTLITLLLLPKTALMAAAASVIGIISEACMGYSSLIWNYRKRKINN